jgi:hypothetical protein
MSDESSGIKPSQIAAAQLKVAIAERTGAEVPDWIRELASRRLGDASPQPGHVMGDIGSAPMGLSLPRLPIPDELRRLARSTTKPSANVEQKTVEALASTKTAEATAARDKAARAAAQWEEDRRWSNARSEVLIRSTELLIEAARAGKQQIDFQVDEPGVYVATLYQSQGFKARAYEVRPGSMSAAKERDDSPEYWVEIRWDSDTPDTDQGRQTKPG